MAKHIFVADFNKWGTPSLAKVQVADETDKTFRVGEYEKLIGNSYIGKQVRKGSVHWFDDGPEALAFLIEEAERHVIRMREKLAGNEKTLADLRATARSIANYSDD